MNHLQDDYLDCYGDPAVTGKIGTDIQDNKCSWLVVKALETMTAEQRAELEVGQPFLFELLKIYVPILFGCKRVVCRDFVACTPLD